MKKFGYYLFAALTTIILPTACMEKLQVSPNPETVLSEPETYAKQISESMLSLRNQLFPQTKSSNGGVSSTELIYASDLTVGTKSSAADDAPLICIVNFEGGGYSISGADPDYGIVYAVVEDGSLTANDFIQSYKAPGLAPLTLDAAERILGESPILPDGDSWFYDAGPDMIFKMIGSAAMKTNGTIQDSLTNPITVGGDEKHEITIGEDDGGVIFTENNILDVKYDYYYSLSSIISGVGDSEQLEWGQGAPFNDQCKLAYTGSDIRCPAGCVAIAVAQILTYNGFPKDGDWDWSLLKQIKDLNEDDENLRDYVAEFVAFLGWDRNCNIRYRSGGSWAVADGAKRTFKNFGYTNVLKSMYIHKFVDAAYAKVENMLKEGKPVFITAADGFEGHAWVFERVADYLYVAEKTTIYKDGTEETERIGAVNECKLLYCNWGWDGSCNGYFSQICLNPDSIIVNYNEDGDDDDEYNNPEDSYIENGRFDWNYKLVTYDL